GNAVKFTDKGHVCIGASLKESNREFAVIEFKITDSGIGIPPHKIESIFESFTQAGNDITRKYGGTGLGLTITRQLIEKQNGSIHVESTPNCGTTFTFCLPYKICKSSIAVRQTADTASSTLPGDLKVLIAEDHDINRFIIEKMFREWGVTCDFAVTGTEAVKAASATCYDVILMDVEMPDMNGYQATEIIRADLPAPQNATPIIAMTGHAMLGEKEKCIGIGMNDYISKPFKPEELKDKIIELTGKRSTSTPLEHVPNMTRPTTASAMPDQTAGMNTSYTVSPADKKIINLDFLREISDNNEQFFTEFIQMFLQNTPTSLHDIEKGIADSDWESIRQAAHKAKPSFNYVGLKDCSMLSAKIEDYAKKKENMEGIREHLATLKTVCQQAYPELENEIKSIKNTL
ncbi:MAG: response regulator, partial [Chitinophagaceae bacterium]|nr:response regulator [Chitinophagaceae bacterium]